MPKFTAPSGKTSSPAKITPVGTIRRSQIITTFGPGAIVELPDYTVLLESCDRWYNHYPPEAFVLHERNLEQMLGVETFREPPWQEKQGFRRPMNIGAKRFPYYHFCPRCGELKRFWEFGGDEQTCQNGHPAVRIIPSRFIVMCPNGHLEDFPYRWWVHHGYPEACRGKGNHLRLSFSNAAEGLAGIQVTCLDCGATRNMTGALGHEAFRGYHCRGQRPWISSHEDECSANVSGALRTASNVYFPTTASALTIPPWSTRIQQLLSHCQETIETCRTLGADEEMTAKALLVRFEKLGAPGETFDPADIRDALRIRAAGEQIETYSEQLMRHDEFKVLSIGDYQASDDLHFRTQQGSVPAAFENLIDSVVLVRRLREVVALKGFSRVYPQSPDFLQPPGARGSNWLPAVEMRGEGIFIRLNEKALRKWEAKAGNFYTAMEDRLIRSDILPPPAGFSARFVLLHTLAHLLIRQLALESGYNAASIKERIYSDSSPKEAMAGILLYTASSDADGSLGGLTRRGRSEPFEQTLMDAFEEAAWCSSDPVCSESRAQGYNSLNYAACHSCTLLPETSCEMRNCLLDRTAVIGTRENRYLGFFGAFVP